MAQRDERDPEARRDAKAGAGRVDEALMRLDDLRLPLPQPRRVRPPHEAGIRQRLLRAARDERHEHGDAERAHPRPVRPATVVSAHSVIAPSNCSTTTATAAMNSGMARAKQAPARAACSAVCVAATLSST